MIPNLASIVLRGQDSRFRKAIDQSSSKATESTSTLTDTMYEAARLCEQFAANR